MSREEIGSVIETGTREGRKEVRRIEVGIRSGQVQEVMIRRIKIESHRRMREMTKGRKVTGDREVGQDHMTMIADLGSSLSVIATNLGGIMNLPVKAVNQLILINSRWQIEIRTRHQKVNRRTGNIRQIKRTNRTDDRGQEEIRVREVIAQETTITIGTKTRTETITIVIIEIRVNKTTKEEKAALVKLI